ncbi:tRNA (guanine-N(1)-)-methyltransferase [Fibrobacterales bacterium]|nr:tRNA (guanine-N(1)-)-methyltransferase [Fibrobacterales bacterium]
MKISCITLFPEMFSPMQCSIIGRAQKNGILQFNTVQLRDFAINEYGQVDDTPYGGEAGMVLRPEPLSRAIDFCGEGFRIFLAADGIPFTQKIAGDLSQKEHLILVCGHYKGIDERVRESRIDMSLSIGDFVVSGGELPAMLLTDSVVRLLPNVLGDSESGDTDSFSSGVQNGLGWAVWTKPQEFEGMRVPEILLSGHHKKIREWQLEQARERTKRIRPELLR